MSADERIVLTEDEGVVKIITTPGSDDKKPSAGDSVFVHYVGTLEGTGEQFDSSRERDEPFRFSLGKGQVIKAWDIGVATMSVGERAILICAPQYAYGPNGSPPKIPANATLRFDVELISYEGEDISPDRDRTITKSVIVEGENFNCPSEFAPVQVHVVGSHDGRVFYDKDVRFELGEASEVGLPEGVDRALRRVNKGEKCRVVLKGHRFTYGAHPPPEYGLPLNAELEFSLFLKDFDKVKASWEMTEAEKIEYAKILKDRGTSFLKEGKLKLALHKYSAISNLLEFMVPTDEVPADTINEVLIAGWLNCALVNQKMNETAESIKNCDKVLEKQPDNVKAIYRKAQGLQNRREYEDAIKLYQRVSELDPANKAPSQQILVCKKSISEETARDKKRYASLFDHLSKMEEAEKAAEAKKAREDPAQN